MKQKALVTGGAGFIGSHLCELLLDEGWEVFVLDNFVTGSKENLSRVIKHPKLHLHEGDVLDRERLSALADGVDTIFHLAASLGVENILSNTLGSIEVNILGTHNVLRIAAEGSKKVFIASTSEVYGKSADIPLKETGDCVYGSTEKNRWSYGTSKAIDEFFALAYWKERHLPVVIGRFFNTVGPRQSGRYGMVIPRLVTQALKGEPLSVHGDGKQTRCFTDVRDVVGAVYQLMTRPEAVGQVFNIGGGIEMSIEDLAKKIKMLTRSASAIVRIPYRQAYTEGYEDMRRRVPDISKISQLTGYKPKVDLETTLRKIIDYQNSVLRAQRV